MSSPSLPLILELHKCYPMKRENELLPLLRDFDKCFVVSSRQQNNNCDSFDLSYFNIFDTSLDESMSWFLFQFVYSQNKGTE